MHSPVKTLNWDEKKIHSIFCEKKSRGTPKFITCCQAGYEIKGMVRSKFKFLTLVTVLKFFFKFYKGKEFHLVEYNCGRALPNVKKQQKKKTQQSSAANTAIPLMVHQL